MKSESKAPVRVLVVEDDAIGAEFAKAILEELGYETVGLAATANEAVELAASQNPDVILMDINLRGPETGIQAAHRIHKTSDVPVIYLTAYSDDKLLEEACGTAPYAYLVKPARDREIHAAIETSLHRAESDRRIKRVNALLSALQDVDRCIGQSAAAQPFLDLACARLIDVLPLRAAWIALRTRPNAPLDWMAGAGDELDFLRTLVDSPENPFPPLPCPEEGADAKTSVLWQPPPNHSLADEFARRRLGPALAVPICFAEGGLGLLGLHPSPGAAIHPEQKALVGEIAAAIGLGLANVQARDRLAESEARYRNLFENRHTPILLIDPKLRMVVDANPAAVDLYGWTRDYMRSMPCAELVDMPVPELHVELARAQRLEVVNFSQLHRTASGALLDVEVHVGPLHVGEGDLLYAIVQDVTRRKRLEDDLRQSSKMEAIGRLAGGVAHDFNNILQAVLGNVELAMMSAQQGESVQPELQEILQAAKRAADITRQLLAFGRRQTIQPKPIDINAHVKSLVIFLKRVIGDNVLLDFRPGPDLPPVMLDATQLDQALLNLCANARDAMPDGGSVQILTAAIELDDAFCSSRSPLQPGPHVRLSVADMGVGMTPHELQHAFEPFYTTKSLGKGTGLGLATVFGIMTQHAGWIEAESAPGKGTTFHLYWPCAAQNPKASADESTAPDRPKGGTETLLVVEDEPGVQLAMSRILTSVGYTVVLASDGRQALERLRAGLRPALAIIDMVMPEMSGMELSRTLEAEFPDVRYLHCSAHSADSLWQGTPPDKRPYLLHKPFTFATLLRLVRNALDGLPLE
jgi:PAS domain S-box-containing protein